jgi:putative MATE family efflux protein
MGIERQRNHIGTDFTEGSIMPMLLRFMLPFLLASILNSLYNTVDTIIIGRFVGSVGIVSVNMGGRLLNLFTSISLTMAGGGQVLISQQFGAKRRDELNSTIGTLFTEMFVLSVVLAVVSSIVAPQVLGLLKTPEESFSGALSYLRITSLGLPLIFGYNAVSSVLRGMGDSRSPLIFIAIAAVCNLIGDIVFIVAFHMGAAGTAIATVLGQGVSLVFSLVVLYRKRAHFGFDFKWKSFAVDWKKLKIMLKIGFPMTLRSLFINLTQMYILRFVNDYGIVESAAYALCDKIIHLTNIFTVSIRQASGGMIGQNIGAKKPERVVTIVRCTAIVAIAAASVLTACALLFPRAFFGLFTDDEAVLVYARPFMMANALIYVLSAVIAPFDAVVVGTGNSFLGFLGGMLDGVIFRLGFSFLFAWTLHMGIMGFLLGDALARLGPIIVGGSYYFSGAWRRRKRLVGDSD